MTAHPPGLEFPLDTNLSLTQTLGGHGGILALQIQNLKLRAATCLGSDQAGAWTQAHVLFTDLTRPESVQSGCATNSGAGPPLIQLKDLG